MPTCAWMRRTLLILCAAVLSAAVSDCVIENAALLGVFGRAFADHDQRSVLSTATAGFVLFVAAALVMLVERLRLQADQSSDWLRVAAHDLATTLSCRSFPCAFVISLIVRYTMESTELLSQTGHLATGVSWLGGPLLISLACHAVACAAMLSCLWFVMRALDRTMKAVIAAMLGILAYFVLRSAPAVAVIKDQIRLAFRTRPLTRRLFERGPPLFTVA